MGLGINHNKERVTLLVIRPPTSLFSFSAIPSSSSGLFSSLLLNSAQVLILPFTQTKLRSKRTTLCPIQTDSLPHLALALFFCSGSVAEMSSVSLWVVCPKGNVASVFNIVPQKPVLRRRRERIVAISAAVANPVVRSSEERVYEVVLKQAALVRDQRTEKKRVETDGSSLTNWDLLNDAYDRCGEVCAEYAKTFYLGKTVTVSLATPQAI